MTWFENIVESRYMELLLTAVVFYLLFRLALWILQSSSDYDEFPVCESGPRLRLGVLWATVVYVILTIIVFRDHIPSLSDALIGPPENNYEFYWNLHWFRGVLFAGSGSLFSTQIIYYPEGSSLLFHSLTWYNLLLSVPLQFLFSLTTVYNLLVLHTFVLSGLGTFLLVRYLVGNEYIALVAGIIFAFNPSHFDHAQHHLNIVSIQFIPFFVYFVVKSIRTEKLKPLILASLFFMLTSLASWNYLIMQAYFLAVVYVYLLIRRRRFIDKRTLIKFIGIVGPTIVVTGFWLVRMIQFGLANPSVSIGGHSGYVIDLCALVTPDAHHLLGKLGFLQIINDTYTGNTWEAAGYLGLTCLVIILASWRHVAKRAAPYLMFALVFLLLSLGDRPHILGISLPIIMPDAILARIPFLSSLRCPSRYIVFVYLFISVLTSYAMVYLYDLKRLGRYTRAVLTVIAVLVLLDFFPHSDAKSVITLPSGYEAIASDGASGAILDIPGQERVAGTYRMRNTFMMYQALHGRPIVQGQISRKAGKSLIDSLDFKNLEYQRAQLISSNVAYIVVHKLFIDSSHAVDVANYDQAYDKIYDDSTHSVYRIEKESSR